MLCYSLRSSLEALSHLLAPYLGNQTNVCPFRKTQRAVTSSQVDLPAWAGPTFSQLTVAEGGLPKPAGSTAELVHYPR